jgi:hypothetical protein
VFWDSSLGLLEMVEAAERLLVVEQRIKNWRFCVSMLLCLSCASCGVQKPEHERREAMLQMQRFVGILHSYWPFVGSKVGFPESAYPRTEDGTITCSWRLTIKGVCFDCGPYLDQSWKAPINQAQDTVADRRMYSVRARDNPSPYTQIFALIGSGTAFTDYGVASGRDSKDAEPDAILLLDSKNHLIHWMEPGDIEVGPLASSSKFSTGFNDLEPNYPEGFLVAFVDVAVWFIRKDVPKEAIAPFYTVEGARMHDREKELAPYAIDKVPPLTKTDGRYYLPPAE